MNTPLFWVYIDLFRGKKRIIQLFGGEGHFLYGPFWGQKARYRARKHLPFEPYFKESK
jgi:hypothetical protein